MASTFKAFNTTDDIVPGDVQVVSQPLWSENINPLSQSVASGYGFYTSSTQVGSSGNYYVNVYQRDPQGTMASSSAVQFALAYGHIYGSGSLDATATQGGGNDTPSRAVYTQYANILLPANTTQFTFNSTGSNEILVLNVARSRFKQKVDPGNWTLRMGSGSGKWFDTDATASYVSFIDNSGAGQDPSIGQAGRVFNIISGSNGVTGSDSTVYGSFYPDAGLMIFHAGLLRRKLGIPFDSSSAVQAQNHITASIAISASSYFSARSEEQINSTNYFVRVINNQYNFTNNPTFVTSGSKGAFKFSSMINNPTVYLTTIGLYDDNNQLLAVAKLSQPLQKTFSREALIKVKLDY